MIILPAVLLGFINIGLAIEITMSNTKDIQFTLYRGVRASTDVLNSRTKCIILICDSMVMCIVPYVDKLPYFTLHFYYEESRVCRLGI